MPATLASISRLERWLPAHASGQTGAHASSPAIALAALIVFAPLFLAIGFAILISSSGPVFVSVPARRKDGRLVFRTEFRTRRVFDTETYDSMTPARWITPVGAALQFLQFARLPVLFDVRAGRIGLAEGLLG